MGKASECYTGGKHAVGTKTIGKEGMMQLIRQCRAANKEARGRHEYSEVLRRNFSITK